MFKRGVLIVFEGISGSGKSESIKQFTKYIGKLSVKSSIIKWNSNKTIRKLIQFLMKSNRLTTNLYSFLQFTGFLIDYFTKIAPLLWRKNILIADRYVFTGIIRNKVNGGGLFLWKTISKLVRTPDIIFF